MLPFWIKLQTRILSGEQHVLSPVSWLSSPSRFSLFFNKQFFSLALSTSMGPLSSFFFQLSWKCCPRQKWGKHSFVTQITNWGCYLKRINFSSLSHFSAPRHYLPFFLQDQDLTEIHRIFTPQQSKEKSVKNSSFAKNWDPNETKQTDASLDCSLNSNCKQT